LLLNSEDSIALSWSATESAASTGAQYIVQGFRGTRMGDASDAVVVQFGVEGGGAGLNVKNATLKMAA